MSGSAVDGYNIEEDTVVLRMGGGMEQAIAVREQIAGISALWYLRPMRGVAQPG